MPYTTVYVVTEFLLVMQVSSHIYYSEPRLKMLHGLKVSALLSITMLKVTHILLRAGVR